MKKCRKQVYAHVMIKTSVNSGIRFFPFIRPFHARIKNKDELLTRFNDSLQIVPFED